MRKMTPAEITSEFNAQKDEFRTYCEKSELGNALRDLAQMVGDLKTSGIDVGLDMFEMPSEMTFKLFHDGGKTVPLGGVLRIGTHQRLIGIMTEFNNKPCLQLGVSRLDIRFQGTHATPTSTKSIENIVRGKLYDLKKDPDALFAFQKDILHAAARTDVIQEYDAHSAFDSSTRMHKPLHKPPFKLGGAV